MNVIAGDASGRNEDKVHLGSLDVTKGGKMISYLFKYFLFLCLGCRLSYTVDSLMVADQLVSESSIPLSPQWLYAKPSESKVVNSNYLLEFRCGFQCHHFAFAAISIPSRRAGILVL